MINSFKDKQVEKIFKRKFSKKLPENIQRIAYRKLLMIHAAINLEDLRTPPSNHLEKLIGDRKGQYSIKINNQWRICFEWKNNNAENVEIVDYH